MRLFLVHLMDSSKKTVQTVVKVGADGLLSLLTFTSTWGLNSGYFVPTQQLLQVGCQLFKEVALSVINLSQPLAAE